MVTHKLIPVCGCFYASGRSKWIMWFQTAPAVFWERVLQQGHWASLFAESYRTFFPILCNQTAQNHCLQYPVALLLTFCIFIICLSHCQSEVIIFPHEFWRFSHEILLHFQSDSCIFLKGTRCLFRLFPNWNVSYVYFCLTHRPALCFSISWEMWWCRGKEEEWANMSWE